MPLPTHEQKIAVVQAYVDAFDAVDADAVAVLFADDAQVEDPVGSPPREGKAAILAFYTEAMKMNARLKLTGPVRTTEEFAAFAFEVQIDLEGRTMVIEVIDTFRFNGDGKIAEMRAFFSQSNIRPA